MFFLLKYVFSFYLRVVLDCVDLVLNSIITQKTISSFNLSCNFHDHSHLPGNIHNRKNPFIIFFLIANLTPGTKYGVFRH